ncbi:hypothetical protein, partial [Escherichia coli]
SSEVISKTKEIPSENIHDKMPGQSPSCTACKNSKKSDVFINISPHRFAWHVLYQQSSVCTKPR